MPNLPQNLPAEPQSSAEFWGGGGPDLSFAFSTFEAARRSGGHNKYPNKFLQGLGRRAKTSISK